MKPITDAPGRFHVKPEPGNGAPPHKEESPKLRGGPWLARILLIIAIVGTGAGLVLWKAAAARRAHAAAGNQPEYREVVTTAPAIGREHRQTMTAIGTVVALRSVTLRNELPGTVREVALTPGRIVEPGELLVGLDVSVEDAELKALEAQAKLAATLLGRMEKAVENGATSQLEVDRARAELDVARAQIARIQAIIERKNIRAPFRARIGISDVHPGQYLDSGTLLTTLQGVDAAAHVDFTVPQQIGHALKNGERVNIVAGPGRPVAADVVALDSRVDPATRSITIRARVANAADVPAPGASVRVLVPAGAPVSGVSVPISALRKGPAGDHVFVIAPDNSGQPRAQMRRVQVGAALGDEVLVLSGLSAGEQVAASGSFKLREGVLVAVAQGDAASGAGH